MFSWNSSKSHYHNLLNLCINLMIKKYKKIWAQAAIQFCMSLNRTTAPASSGAVPGDGAVS